MSVPLQVHALRKLYSVIDSFWAEAADYIAIIEGLSEDASFPDVSLAAAVVSKVSAGVSFPTRQQALYAV